VNNKVIVSGSGYDGVYNLYVNTIFDKAGNSSSSKSDNFRFDNTDPEMNVVTITSSNVNNKENENIKYAMIGDTITVSMTASEAIYEVPTVLIGGKEATVNWASGKTSGKATVVCDETMVETEGEDYEILIVNGIEKKVLLIEIKGYEDKAGNVGDIVTETTDGSLVTIDDELPQITIESIVSKETEDGESDMYAKNGDIIIVTMSADEAIYTKPTVTIGQRNAEVTWESGTTTGTATYTIPSNEKTMSEGLLAVSISGYKDESNNIGPTVTTVTQEIESVIYDRTAPVINFNPNRSMTYAQKHSTVVTVSDNLSGLKENTVEYAWSENAPTEWSEPVELDQYGEAILEGEGYDGILSLWINTVSDNSGNIATKQSGEFKFDNTAPEVSNITIESDNTRNIEDLVGKDLLYYLREIFASNKFNVIFPTRNMIYAKLTYGANPLSKILHAGSGNLCIIVAIEVTDLGSDQATRVTK
jgi:hypothetical protein